MQPLSRLGLGAILFGLIPTAAAAQINPLTVPAGSLRLDFGGEFRLWDWRWLDGGRQESAADFGRASLDRSFIPGLATAEQHVAAITGLSAVDLSAGRSIATTLTNFNTLGVGAAFGLTRRITVFGVVPIVSVKVEPRFLIDSTVANASLNPLAGDLNGGNSHQLFVGELVGAAAALDAAIKAGTYDADPAQKALAQSTLARTQSFATEFAGLLASSNYFLPRVGSAIGSALLQAITSLNQTLGALQIGSVSSPLLPTSAMDAAGFNSYLSDPNGPIQARPIDELPVYSFLGDIEFGAVVSLVDKFPTSTFGSGLRVYGQTTIRLRTATLANPNRFLEIGSGDRQPDVEMMLTTDVAAGRFGARLAGGYNLQLPGNQNRRVTRFDQPIAPASTLAGVRRDPGDAIILTARPFIRLATYLSLFGGVDFWAKGRDAFSYAAGQPPVEGIDINVLGDGTKTDALLLSGGVSYSHSGLNKRGLRRLPMDASFRYQRIVRSGSGIVPDANTVSINLRLYARLFGRNAP